MPKPRRKPATGQRRRQRSRRRRLTLSRRQAKVLLPAALVALAVLWLWRAPPPPTDPGDLCAIYHERLSWYRDSRIAARRWGVPEPVLVAILAQESGLRADARPPRLRFLRIFPGRRPSSAYGYAQVVDATWRQFESEVGRDASRRRFADAVDFVGWYARELYDSLDLAESQTEELYLAYHEGPNGYRRGSHRAKPALRRSARTVAGRAARYTEQLAGCRPSIERRLFWRGARRALVVWALALGVGALTWRRLRR